MEHEPRKYEIKIKNWIRMPVNNGSYEPQRRNHLHKNCNCTLSLLDTKR